MVYEKVNYPYCGDEDVVRNGGNPKGKQRYLCHNQDCKCKSLTIIPPTPTEFRKKILSKKYTELSVVT